MPDNVLYLALAEAFESKAKNLDVKPGTYAIDTEVLVRIKGALTRQNDTTEEKKITIPLNRVLAVAVQRLKLDHSECQKLVSDIIGKALTLGEQPRPAIAAVLADVDAAIKQFHEANHQPAKPKKGALKGMLQVELTASK